MAVDSRGFDVIILRSLLKPGIFLSGVTEPCDVRCVALTLPCFPVCCYFSCAVTNAVCAGTLPTTWPCQRSGQVTDQFHRCDRAAIGAEVRETPALSQSDRGVELGDHSSTALILCRRRRISYRLPGDETSDAAEQAHRLEMRELCRSRAIRRGTAPNQIHSGAYSPQRSVEFVTSM